MDLNQDVLLPVLFAVIVANVAIVGLLFAASRIGRHRSAVADGLGSGSADPLSVAAQDPTGRERSYAAAVSAREAGQDPTPLAVLADTGPDAADDGSPGPSEVADALTGLPDAAAFNRLLTLEDARLQRYHRPATVVIFDLDGLDRLVALLGPGAGERILPAVADTIRRLARDADAVARLGDARFGVLLPETDEVAAINYVERVRRACELWLEAGAIALHLAIGWAGTIGDPTMHEALRLATERMYAERRRHERRTEPAVAAGGAPSADVVEPEADAGRIAS